MKTAPVLTPQREHLVWIVRHHPGLSLRAIAEIVGLDETTVQYHMRRLAEARVVVQERRGRALVHYLTGVSP